ncbi:MAG: lipid-A-disaccharide synthase [Alphaproteobacteria bacterium]|nr:lipid-A-disaccharide synthase [Alphaproteobacteria bacterium]
MKKVKKFFVIAGEASGDLLGSKLIRELKTLEPDAMFFGVGGKLMQQEGFVSLFPMEDLSVMGFAEVVPHLLKIIRRINQTAAMINQEKPDYLITIDSPDFCFRVVKKVTVACKKIHLIAPSVWAYRPGRAKKIAKLYDLLLCILPFEPPYFTKHGLNAVFIGHPLVSAQFPVPSAQCSGGLRVALTPGSRTSEVTKIFPEFIGAINLLQKKFPNLEVVIPLADKTRELVIKMAQGLQVPYSFSSTFSQVDFALAKSGTNALEFSLHKIPLVVAYKVSWLSYYLARLLVKIKFANLLNLILNREVIPEMLQKNCSAKKLAAALELLILDKNLAQKQIAESQVALKLLGLGNIENPSQRAAREILKICRVTRLISKKPSSAL